MQTQTTGQAPVSSNLSPEVRNRLLRGVNNTAAREFASAIVEGRNYCAKTIASVFNLDDAQTKPYALKALTKALGNDNFGLGDRITQEFKLKDEETIPAALAAFGNALKGKTFSGDRGIEVAAAIHAKYPLPPDGVKAASQEAYESKMAEHESLAAARIAKSYGLEAACVKLAATKAYHSSGQYERAAEIAEEFSLGRDMVVAAANASFHSDLDKADTLTYNQVDRAKNAADTAVKYNLGRERVVRAASKAFGIALKMTPRRSFSSENTSEWAHDLAEMANQYALEKEVTQKMLLDSIEGFLKDGKRGRVDSLCQSFEIPKDQLAKRALAAADHLLLGETAPAAAYDVRRILSDYGVPEKTVTEMVRTAYGTHMINGNPEAALGLAQEFSIELSGEKIAAAASKAFEALLTKKEYWEAANLGLKFHLDAKSINEAALKSFEEVAGQIYSGNHPSTQTLIGEFKLKPEQTGPIAARLFENALAENNFELALKLVDRFSLGAERLEKAQVMYVEHELEHGSLSHAKKHAREFGLPNEITEQLEQLDKLREQLRA